MTEDDLSPSRVRPTGLDFLITRRDMFNPTTGDPRVILITSMAIGGLLYIPQAIVRSGWQILLLQALVGVAAGGIVPSISALQALAQCADGSDYVHVHSPRLKNSRCPRIALMRSSSNPKSPGRSTKLSRSELTISTGVPV